MIIMLAQARRYGPVHLVHYGAHGWRGLCYFSVEPSPNLVVKRDADPMCQRCQRAWFRTVDDVRKQQDAVRRMAYGEEEAK